MFKPINKHLIVKVVEVKKESAIIKPEAFKSIEHGVVCHEIMAVCDSLDFKPGEFAVYQSQRGVEYFPEGNTPNDPEYKVLRGEDLLGVKNG